MRSSEGEEGGRVRLRGRIGVPYMHLAVVARPAIREEGKKPMLLSPPGLRGTKLFYCYSYYCRGKLLFDDGDE